MEKFSIELRPGETTIVSWKKLLKDSSKSSTPTSSTLLTLAQPAATAALLQGEPAETEPNDKTAPSRFSAVIEKIERLYVGNQSSDEEELGGVPDDDQYDTGDSFIDDADLDEYFQVDKSTTKHNGFFVNRGKLESMNELSSSPPKHQRIRRGRNAMTTCSEMDNEHIQNKHAQMGNMGVQAASTTALLGSKSSSPSQSLVVKSDHYDNEKLSQPNATTGPPTEKSTDSNIKMENSIRDASTFPLKAKGREKLKVAGESGDSPQIYKDRSPPTQMNLQSKRPLTDMKEMQLSSNKQQKKNVSTELPDLNFPRSEIPLKILNTSIHVKEGSSARSKCSVLERAIRELEKVVSESAPQSVEILVANTSQQVKRRLPREVKQKLAKVARLASSQGKITEELINRLMSILGHMVQRKTLQRNLKEMAELGLSAKKEKDDKFQHIKKEVAEMIRIRAPSLKAKVNMQRDEGSNDFKEVYDSEGKGVLKIRYMDNAMEDKICNLYDLYVEGLDEDKGPQIRKLYVELAELWPGGTMDSHGIRNAICRSKARKRATNSRLKNLEKMKQNKLSATTRSEGVIRGEGSSVTQPRVHAFDSSTIVENLLNHISSNSPNQYHVTSERMSNSSTNVSGMNQPKREKIKGNSTTYYLDELKKTTEHAVLNKKVKSRPDSDLQRKERHESQMQSTNYSHKSSMQMDALPGCGRIN